MGYSFPKTDRLLRREEYLAAQKRGRRVHSAHFVIVLLERCDKAGPRLGLVTSRKVSSAVGRNRIRRHLRETFRLHRACFPPHHDVVVIAKEGAAALDSAAIRSEILRALERGVAPRRRPPAQGATP
jgi:ribonuclease P protein component